MSPLNIHDRVRMDGDGPSVQGEPLPLWEDGDSGMIIDLKRVCEDGKWIFRAIVRLDNGQAVHCLARELLLL